MFKNLKIGKKLIVSFIAISLLASIAGVISMFITKNIDTQYSFALVDYGFSQGDIGKTMVNLANSRAAIYNVVSFTDEVNIKNAKTELEQGIQGFNDGMVKIKDTLATDEERALYDSIMKNITTFTQKRDAVIAMGDTTDPEMSKKAQQLAVSELDPAYDAVYANINKLFELTVSTGTDLSQQLTNSSNASILLIIVLVIVAFTVSILLGVFISRSIANPMTACSERLRKLAEGDLKSPVPQVDTKDETGILAEATDAIVTGLQEIIEDEDYLLGEMSNGNFDIHTRASDKYVGDFAPILMAMRKIRTGLSDTLSQINQAADQVSGGSDQVASGAQALSQGATEQASSVQELAATINEISQQTSTNASNAAEASGKVNDASASIDESNQHMQDMISAMSEISETSGKIGKIIKTIEDIAFQTNILALNAAVEAARAGAAGKGFAVVADEVRSLASKSGEAAKNTTELIESSIRAVENGTRIAGETAQSMTAVVGIAREASTIVDRISEASKSQADSIAQVTTGVDQISSVVQTNSATAEESAAASEELSSQARLLKELVGRFRLATDNQSGFSLGQGIDSFGPSAPSLSAPSDPFGEIMEAPRTAAKPGVFASANEY